MVRGTDRADTVPAGHHWNFPNRNYRAISSQRSQQIFSVSSVHRGEYHLARFPNWESSSRNRANHQKRLFPRGDRFRQERIRRFVRQIFLARKEAQKWSSLLRVVVANCPAQHGISRFQRIKHRALCHSALHIEFDFSSDMREVAQMIGQLHPNHGNVCTSTESTLGKSCTIACQLSPLSFEQYTCPPLVPK